MRERSAERERNGLFKLNIRSSISKTICKDLCVVAAVCPSGPCIIPGVPKFYQLKLQCVNVQLNEKEMVY